MDILTQLNAAVTYIEENIENDLALADVSKVTSYSSFHFGRLFSYIAEMPLSEYIRKRKLSLAAQMLQSSNIPMKILDLAITYGYDSADSFTRAFVKQHGVTPSAARQKGVSLSIFPPLTFQIKIKGGKAINWRIEEREEFEVFGLEGVFHNDDTDKIAIFWQECLDNGSYVRLSEAARGSALNAICSYREIDDETFPYMIFAEIIHDSKVDGFTTATVPKATWAVFKSDKFTPDKTGEEIPNLYSRAYSEWLPTSGYNKANGSEMEIYYEDEDGMCYEEVWIPVIKL
ncbi:MAG: AraC family transcriptional regulator [Defluviitaleaceae bacterium]|nr:AraC family transcriptional regulator [Defluviitaleaceae bacterium]